MSDNESNNPDASDDGEQLIKSFLVDSDEVLTAVKGIIRWTKNFSDLDFVKNAAKASYEVQEGLEYTVFCDAKTFNETPLTNEDFLAWSRSKRGRKDARGQFLMNNALLNMLYNAYCISIALLHLPDWIRDKCAELEDKAENNRERDSNDAQERADKYQDLFEEFEPYADEADGCASAASNLKDALEAGNLTDAVAAIDDGDLFLDIGYV